MQQKMSRRRVLLRTTAGIGMLPVMAGVTSFVFQRIFHRSPYLLISTESTDAAWSPDGTQIASAGWDGFLSVWNASTGQALRACILETTGSSVYPLAVVWSADGRSLLAFFGEYPGKNASEANRINRVQIWDAATGQRLRSVPILSDAMKPEPSVSLGDAVHVVAWALSEGYLAVQTGMDSQELEIWNIATGNKVAFPKPTLRRIAKMTWAPQSAKLAVVSDGRLELWDISAGKKMHTFTLASQADEVIAWSFDGKFIAVGTTIYEVETGRNVTVYQGKGRLISQAWLPNGRYLAANFLTGSRPYGPLYSRIYLIDASRGEQIATYDEGEIDPSDNMYSSPRKMIWSPNGKDLLVVRSKGVEIWKEEAG